MEGIYLENYIVSTFLKLGFVRKPFHPCISDMNVTCFVTGSRGGSSRLNLGTHNLPLFFPPVVEVPNIPLRVSRFLLYSAQFASPLLRGII